MMAKKLRIINVGDTDANADWIKTAKSRAEEERIYQELAAEIRKREEPIEGESGQ